ncbi:MAG: pseudouridine-5'-phosphate glycosidase [Anaerolineaceae bacterium]|nr:pseudouridine-5'-phosphate glycosidase [Anaerolineaceae bacterium]
MNKFLNFSQAIQFAQAQRKPIVALETAVLTHGLPYPTNIILGLEMEALVRENGAEPATIAMIDGKFHIGLTQEQVSILGDPSTQTKKISRRDIGIAMANHLNGGTTVCGTLIAANAARIKVFATGGIGGVHRGNRFDISADLQELSHTPMVVVCAGAKSILDLPATLEYLETMGVPVIGYETDIFPAFFSRNSGLPVNSSVKSPSEVAEIAVNHWKMGLNSAILLVVPPPEKSAIDYQKVESIIVQALAEAERQGIHGANVTPFLLAKVNELSKGRSMKANLDLLKNNARIAANVAAELNKLDSQPLYI